MDMEWMNLFHGGIRAYQSIFGRSKENVITEYFLKILGLDICADTMVGNVMIRGEMLVGPTKAFFMDEISHGPDKFHDFPDCERDSVVVHILGGTAMIALLQPAPETYDLFDDIVLLSMDILCTGVLVRMFLSSLNHWDSNVLPEGSCGLLAVKGVDGRGIDVNPITRPNEEFSRHDNFQTTKRSTENNNKKQIVVVVDGHIVGKEVLCNNGRLLKNVTLRGQSPRSKAACGITNKPKDAIIDIDAADVDNHLAMRDILVEWLIEVHNKFELMHETLYLTVHIVDRYLSMRSVSRKILRLIGMSAMLIASKYEEIGHRELALTQDELIRYYSSRYDRRNTSALDNYKEVVGIEVDHGYCNDQSFLSQCAKYNGFPFSFAYLSNISNKLFQDTAIPTTRYPDTDAGGDMRKVDTETRKSQYPTSTSA
ncbi:hypothetical protein IFM89_020408 [Coptis chinensis]|uniref:Cyclin-like domain-containing protein n=1 Tax=Coptis chinensis TaxID=261450 RepID=A0A835HGD3_9MAGN|nr:hypothetical protein IFM89_020408 [Coptis chinensis]